MSTNDFSDNWDDEPINTNVSKKIGTKPQADEDDSLIVGNATIFGLPEPIEFPTKFDDMGFKESLLRGIYSYGFEVPSKIQQICVPIMNLVQNRQTGKRFDVLAQSNAGTGKTGAFTCGILQIIDETQPHTQSIIVAPTRELTTQIHSVITDLGSYMKIKTALCLGGIPIDDNLRDIKNAHVIVGTPGRLNDIIQRKAIDMTKIKILVIDEVDELLKKEFINQTRDIIIALPLNTQICVFSATLQEDVVKTTKKFMSNPIRVLIGGEKISLDLIAQYYIDVVQDKYKLDTLDDIYRKLSIGQCIIYVNFKDKAKWLQEEMTDRGHAVESIHADLTPLERTNIMKQFRSGECRVLISTDLLSRGIDVQQVGYVINYDIPYDIDCYLHRIGRSGRYGKKGVAINFMTKRDTSTLKQIMERHKVKIESMPEPEYLEKYLKE